MSATYFIAGSVVWFCGQRWRVTANDGLRHLARGEGAQAHESIVIDQQEIGRCCITDELARDAASGPQHELCMKRFVASLLALALAGFAGSAQAVDWGDCVDQLNKLRREASDASDAASEADTRARELEDCKSDPQGRDRCRDEADGYRTAVERFKSQASDVRDLVQRASTRCGYNFAPAGVLLPGMIGPAAASPANPLCQAYRNQLGKMPTESLLKVCMGTQPEAFCRQCLQ
ncbi:hypothetical protein [Variovorax rhizosphaerae]|uniref:Lysozyme inhibitor LprI N-terminal domain-containing protein n=1 Tax=Variovorax rhizosphaerae TaxID=1836200 RepID=A0ABU8WQ33_9BURK